MNSFRKPLLFASLLLVPLMGCTKTDVGTDTVATSEAGENPEVSSESVEQEPVDLTPKVYETVAQELLAVQLPEEQTGQGWVRLFDGYTLFGWEIVGEPLWGIDDQTIVAKTSKPSFLSSSMEWKDYELELEVRTDPKANCGLFLRCPLAPDESGADCYKICLSDQDKEFPAGSVMNREKSNFDPAKSSGDWRTVNVVVQGNQIKVKIDGQQVCNHTDPDSEFSMGRIALGHVSGRSELRNIRLRPIGLENRLDEELSQWTKYPKMSGKFSVNHEGWLHIEGGRTQLESKESYGDFALLVEYKLPTEEMNSGIFFRCIPGDEMMGYECQLSNALKDGNPLIPADCGTGGFFRRQDARLVVGKPGEWVTVMLVVNGPTMASWVNGVQVSNWYDDREAHENPRKGLRLEPGTLMIQGHDPETDAWIRTFQVTPQSKEAPREASDPSE